MLRCPHCRTPLKSADNESPVDGSCPSCGREIGGLAETLTNGTPTESPHTGGAPDSPFPEIPGYQIIEVFGRGGMGVVYKARDLRLKRLVALKVILAGAHAGEDDLARFRIEAETVARLQHPNIVQIFEVGKHDNRPFLALEFVDGGTLQSYVQRHPLTAREAAELLEIIARAVHYAHQQSIVHRDLKPANILLMSPMSHERPGEHASEPAGHASLATAAHATLAGLIPKINDFGLAKHLDLDSHHTRSGTVLGTPSFMAPEQASGRVHDVGPAADVYSLGAILYALLTGRPPFRGESMVETLLMVQQEDPVPPRHWQPRLPKDLETICLKCLEKQASRRYDTAMALADDLRRFLTGEPIQSRPVSLLERSVKWVRRRPALALSLAAIVFVAAGGIAGIWWQMQEAITARHKAERLATDARFESYRANIAAASAALQLNLGTAQQRLDAAPEEYRNWEWKHYYSQLDGSLAVLRGHTAAVHAVALNNQGTRIVTSSGDKTVRLWDAATGRALHVLRGPSGGLRDAVFSPDGNRIATVAWDGCVRIFAAQSGELLCECRGEKKAASVAFVPDGKRVMGVVAEKTVQVWDVDTGAPVAVLSHSDSVKVFVVNGDGSRMVTSTGDEKLHLWDEKFQRIAVLPQHEVDVLALAFSPDGQRFASASWAPESSVRLWDARRGEALAEYRGHTNNISDVAFSPDGQRLVTASADETVRVWDVTSRKGLAVFRGHTDYVFRARFSPDGRRVMSASSDGTMRVWDANSGAPIAVLRGHEGSVRAMDASHDGTVLVSASTDQTVRLWNLPLVEQANVLRGHTNYVYSVAVSPDGSRVASAAWDRTVRLWDALTRRQLAVLMGHTDLVGCVDFSPDGKRLASGSADATVRVWNVEEAAAELELHGHAKPRTNESLGRAGVNAVTFSPDGTTIASAAGDKTIRLWKATSGRAIAVWRGHTQGIRSIAFHPDGQKLASASADKTARIWDVRTGKTIAVLSGHEATLHSVAFRRDGEQIVTSSSDKSVILWDVATGAEIANLKHPSIVYSAAFSPDGTRVAAACRDNSIRLWDTARREEVAVLHGHRAYVHSIAFSSDSARLVSGSGDFSVRIWDTVRLRDRVGLQSVVGPH